MQVKEVVRLKGCLQDADTLGPLVWARSLAGHIWWPAEVLDPYALPPTRMLPPGATVGEWPTERPIDQP